MNKNEIIEEIRSKLPEYLRENGIDIGSDGRRKFCCLNPDHSDNNPSMNYLKAGERVYCHSCGTHYDIFDLIGIEAGESNFNRQLSIAMDKYGYSTEKQSIHNKTYTTRTTQQSIHNNEEIQEEKDYTEYFLEANKHISETSYHRGISLATLNRFLIGYDPTWKHSSAPDGVKPTERLIIPTGKSSYIARYTGKDKIVYTDRSGKETNYSKMAEGKKNFINLKAVFNASSEESFFIVEGEIDALSIIDLGYNAVSMGSIVMVPKLLKILSEKKPNCSFIIAFDNDPKVKQSTRENVEKKEIELYNGIESLGMKAIMLTDSEKEEFYLGCKDSNEALNKDREKFKEMIDIALEKMESKIHAKEEIIAQRSVKNQLQSFIDEIGDMEKNRYIPTGFYNLDTALDGGLYAGLYFIGAVSSLGKTSFVLQIADNIAKSGEDVMIFSMEMAPKELIAKSISRITFIKDRRENASKSSAKSTRGILTGSKYSSYTDKEKALIKDSIEEYSETIADHVFIEYGIANITVEYIKEKVMEHISITGRKPIVVIDYIQILEAPEDKIRCTDKQITDYDVKQLKLLSSMNDLTIIGISSFNRDSYNDPVDLTSFKESGAIEYSSDILIGLQYQGMDYQKSESDKERKIRLSKLKQENGEKANKGECQEIQLKILKNRNGRKNDNIPLLFYPVFNYFEAKIEAEKGNDKDGWTKI